MKKVLCVIRVSTMQQEIESQKNDMINFLHSKGYADEEIEWLETKGASARKVNKIYLGMIEQIKVTITLSTSIKAVAVWHLNRLGRVESYLIQMKEWFIKNHVQLYIKNPDLTLLNEDGTENPGTSILFSVMSSMIPAETEEMMEKMQRGRNYKRENGIYTGEPLNYGFKVENSRVVVDVDAMEEIKMIYSLYASGKYSTYKLSRELDERGLQYTDVKLSKILNKECYREYVGEEIWEKVKEVQRNTICRSTTKESKNCFVALGLLHCSTCGTAYVSNSEYYECLKTKMRRRYGSGCNAPMIKCIILDTLLWDVAFEHHISYLMMSDTTQIEDVKSVLELQKEKLAELERKLSKTAEKELRITELYIDCVLTKKQYEEKKSGIQTDRNNILNNIELKKREIEKLNLDLSFLLKDDKISDFKMMKSVILEENKEKQREIVRQHIDCVELTRCSYMGKKKAIKINIVDKNKCEYTYYYIQGYRGDPFKKVYDSCGVYVPKKLIWLKTLDNLIEETEKGGAD